MVDGEAVQVIAPSLRISFAVVDLRDRPEGEREEEARWLVRKKPGGPLISHGGRCFEVS